MQDKPVALVTGANTGIGLQITKDLAAHGFTVLVGKYPSAGDLHPRDGGTFGRLPTYAVCADARRSNASRAEHVRQTRVWRI